MIFEVAHMKIRTGARGKYFYWSWPYRTQPMDMIFIFPISEAVVQLLEQYIICLSVQFILYNLNIWFVQCVNIYSLYKFIFWRRTKLFPDFSFHFKTTLKAWTCFAWYSGFYYLPSFQCPPLQGTTATPPSIQTKNEATCPNWGRSVMAYKKLTPCM